MANITEHINSNIIKQALLKDKFEIFLLANKKIFNGKYCNLQNYMLEYRCFNSYFKSNNFFDKIQKLKTKKK